MVESEKVAVEAIQSDSGTVALNKRIAQLNNATLVSSKIQANNKFEMFPLKRTGSPKKKCSITKIKK